MIRYQVIIQRYTNMNYDCLCNMRCYFRNMDNIESVIEHAAMSIDENGRKYCHQRRIPHNVLLNVKQKLYTQKIFILKCKTFDEIYNVIESCRVKGFGDLSIYDSALRIGAFLGIEPDKIYLHAGTKKGAKNLGVDIRGKKVISKDELPSVFRKMKPVELEDLLCIYKDYFH